MGVRDKLNNEHRRRDSPDYEDDPADMIETSEPIGLSADGFHDIPLHHTPYRAYMETSPQYIPGQGVSRYMPSLRNLVPIRRAKKSKNSINVDKVGLFSFVFYSWLSPFMYKAYKRGLTQDDIPQGSPLESCDLNAQRLELLWQEEVAHKGNSGASFGRVIWKFIRTRIIVQCIIFSSSIAMGFLSPTIFMRKLLEFAEDKEESVANGVIWALCVTACEFLRIIFFAWNWALSYRTGIRLRSACLALLYRKIIRLNSLGDRSIGELINIFANDSQRIFDMVLFGPMIIGGPLVTICGVCYIYWLLGAWALFGMVTFLLFYPTQYGISRLTSYLRGKTIVITDLRVKLMTEILTCIKFIKMYAWEEHFRKSIQDTRKDERALLQRASYVQSVSMSLASTVPVISAIVTFLAHIGAGNNLSAAQAFPIVVYMRQQVGLALILVFESGLRLLDGFIGLRRFQAFSAYIFLFRHIRSAMLQMRDSALSILEGFIVMPKFQAFPLTCVFGNQLKDALSRIREGSKAIVDSVLAFSRMKAFPMITILNSLMRVSFDNLRIGTSNIYESLPGFKRIKRILVMEESSPYIIRPIDKTEAVNIVNGTFAYNSVSAFAMKSSKVQKSLEEQDPEKEKLNPDVDGKYAVVLKDITFYVPKGKLIGICGSVGSGKTSLLLACLGQMKKLSGQVLRDGSCAYVSQEAWIQNTTLRENILFGESFDAKRYYESVYACSLSEDINMLPGGDDTEIGERGMNLSGGQKQRVALARALYSDRDVYFLDDPLSAVDAHVGASIFQRYIMKALRGKTVIFVTHQVQYLNNCDEIYMLKDGCIIEQGTHNDLMALDGEYAGMVKSCLLEIDRNDSTLSEGQNATKGSDVDLPSSVPPTRVSSGLEQASTTPEGDGKESGRVAGEHLMTTETMERGRIRFQTYHSYIAAAGGYGVLVLVSLVFFLNVGSSVFSSWWLAMWIKDGGGPVTNFNNETTKSEDLSANPNYSLYRTVYASTIAVIFGSSLLRGFVFTKASLRASTTLHNRLFDKIICSPMMFFETTPTGRIQNLFSRDMDEVDARLPLTVESIMQNSLIVLFAILMICLVFPWFIIPMAFLAGFYYFISKIFRVAIRDLKRIESISRSPIFSWVGNTVHGLSTINAFEKENNFIKRFTQMLDENSTCLYLSCVAGRWLAVRVDNLAVIITCVTAFLIIVLHGQVPPALAGLALAYSAHIAGVFQYTIRLISETEARFISVERINSYLQSLVREGDSSQKVKPGKNWPNDGQIKFRNVCLSYRRGLPDVLKNVSFTINPGEKIGIVGRTGSGKSTLIVALFRLVELSSGKIKIDGINIAEIDLEILRSNLTVIPQDPVLFAGTIRSNIDPSGSFSDSEVWNALEKTRLKSKVASSPGQLDATVNQGGDNFSVGERQLLCLARALLKNAKILLLDEATAAVDPETEAVIHATIQKEFSHSTVLTIAHRISSVTSSDRVLVMDKGQLVEFDEPSLLLADANSQFYQLCSAAEEAVQQALPRTVSS